ncbi:hypothetical protein EBR96_02425 [bacterium]|nr:hypothetical protein [bacterium]
MHISRQTKALEPSWTDILRARIEPADKIAILTGMLPSGKTLESELFKSTSYPLPADVMLHGNPSLFNQLLNIANGTYVTVGTNQRQGLALLCRFLSQRFDEPQTAQILAVARDQAAGVASPTSIEQLIENVIITISEVSGRDAEGGVKLIKDEPEICRVLFTSRNPQIEAILTNWIEKTGNNSGSGVNILSALRGYVSKNSHRLADALVALNDASKNAIQTAIIPKELEETASLEGMLPDNLLLVRLIENLTPEQFEAICWPSTLDGLIPKTEASKHGLSDVLFKMIDKARGSEKIKAIINTLKVANPEVGELFSLMHTLPANIPAKTDDLWIKGDFYLKIIEIDIPKILRLFRSDSTQSAILSADGTFHGVRLIQRLSQVMAVGSGITLNEYNRDSFLILTLGQIKSFLSNCRESELLETLGVESEQLLLYENQLEEVIPTIKSTLRLSDDFKIMRSSGEKNWTTSLVAYMGECGFEMAAAATRNLGRAELRSYLPTSAGFTPYFSTQLYAAIGFTSPDQLTNRYDSNPIKEILVMDPSSASTSQVTSEEGISCWAGPNQTFALVGAVKVQETIFWINGRTDIGEEEKSKKSLAVLKHFVDCAAEFFTNSGQEIKGTTGSWVVYGISVILNQDSANGKIYLTPSDHASFRQHLSAKLRVTEPNPAPMIEFGHTSSEVTATMYAQFEDQGGQPVFRYELGPKPDELGAAAWHRHEDGETTCSVQFGTKLRYWRGIDQAARILTAIAGGDKEEAHTEIRMRCMQAISSLPASINPNEVALLTTLLRSSQSLDSIRKTELRQIAHTLDVIRSNSIRIKDEAVLEILDGTDPIIAQYLATELEYHHSGAFLVHLQTQDRSANEIGERITQAIDRSTLEIHCRPIPYISASAVLDEVATKILPKLSSTVPGLFDPAGGVTGVIQIPIGNPLETTSYNVIIPIGPAEVVSRKTGAAVPATSVAIGGLGSVNVVIRPIHQTDREILVLNPVTIATGSGATHQPSQGLAERIAYRFPPTLVTRASAGAGFGYAAILDPTPLSINAFATEIPTRGSVMFTPGGRLPDAASAADTDAPATAGPRMTLNETVINLPQIENVSLAPTSAIAPENRLSKIIELSSWIDPGPDVEAAFGALYAMAQQRNTTQLFRIFLPELVKILQVEGDINFTDPTAVIRLIEAGLQSENPFAVAQAVIATTAITGEQIAVVSGAGRGTPVCIFPNGIPSNSPIGIKTIVISDIPELAMAITNATPTLRDVPAFVPQWARQIADRPGTILPTIKGTGDTCWLEPMINCMAHDIKKIISSEEPVPAHLYPVLVRELLLHLPRMIEELRKLEIRVEEEEAAKTEAARSTDDSCTDEPTAKFLKINTRTSDDASDLAKKINAGQGLLKAIFSLAGCPDASVPSSLMDIAKLAKDIRIFFGSPGGNYQDTAEIFANLGNFLAEGAKPQNAYRIEVIADNTAPGAEDVAIQFGDTWLRTNEPQSINPIFNRMTESHVLFEAGNLTHQIVQTQGAEHHIIGSYSAIVGADDALPDELIVQVVNPLDKSISRTVEPFFFNVAGKEIAVIFQDGVPYLFHFSVGFRGSHWHGLFVDYDQPQTAIYYKGSNGTNAALTQDTIRNAVRYMGTGFEHVNQFYRRIRPDSPEFAALARLGMIRRPEYLQQAQELLEIWNKRKAAVAAVEPESESAAAVISANTYFEANSPKVLLNRALGLPDDMPMELNLTVKTPHSPKQSLSSAPTFGASDFYSVPTYSLQARDAFLASGGYPYYSGDSASRSPSPVHAAFPPVQSALPAVEGDYDDLSEEQQLALALALSKADHGSDATGWIERK